MTVRAFLARHATHADVGKRLSGRSDIALSDEGEAEALRLAARLSRHPLAAIHSSPRVRTLQTAQAMADATGLPIKTIDALDEIDFGTWAGRSFEDLAPDPDWQQWNRARGTAPTPGGETMVQATARAVAHLDGVGAAGSGPIALVTHCDIIRGVVAHYLGLALDRLLLFDIDPASITTLDLTPPGARLVALNERP